MWPFKKKEIKLCANCIHCELSTTRCNRRAKSRISVITGKQSLTPGILRGQLECEEERELWATRWLPWCCGKSGWYYEDKRKWE